MEEKEKEKTGGLTEEQISDFKRRIIDKSIKKYVLNSNAPKRKVYDVVKEYVFTWADVNVIEHNEHHDTLSVTVATGVVIDFEFIWENTPFKNNYRLSEVR